MIEHEVLQRWQAELSAMVGEIGEDCRHSTRSMPPANRELQAQLQVARMQITWMLQPDEGTARKVG